eukprot:6204820-Pleurochrysis_carterae.AAC.1
MPASRKTPPERVQQTSTRTHAHLECVNLQEAVEHSQKRIAEIAWVNASSTNETKDGTSNKKQAWRQTENTAIDRRLQHTIRNCGLEGKLPNNSKSARRGAKQDGANGQR